jgi:hypothetical protein
MTGCLQRLLSLFNECGGAILNSLRLMGSACTRITCALLRTLFKMLGHGLGRVDNGCASGDCKKVPYTQSENAIK